MMPNIKGHKFEDYYKAMLMAKDEENDIALALVTALAYKAGALVDRATSTTEDPAHYFAHWATQMLGYYSPKEEETIEENLLHQAKSFRQMVQGIEESFAEY